jgi:hypothetical protein
MPDDPLTTFPIAPPTKKTQEDLNVEVYENVFKKCLEAAGRLVYPGSDSDRENQVKIATAIFDRFYNDQTAMKAGATQAKAMIDAMTQVLEGRR